MIYLKKRKEEKEKNKKERLRIEKGEKGRNKVYKERKKEIHECDQRWTDGWWMVGVEKKIF